MAALDNKEYFIESLEELRKHAKEKLKESRKLWRQARRSVRLYDMDDAGDLWEKAWAFEVEARQDFATIQELLADGRLNR